MALGASTSLTFTITNTNVSTLTGVAFSDTLPAGLVVASPNGLTGSCGGGTITAVAGTNVVSLATATLTAGQQCQFAVNVTGSTAGAKSNTTGTIASTESGVGSTASASVTVVAPADDQQGVRWRDDRGQRQHLAHLYPHQSQLERRAYGCRV
jgi:uncharacterized repeat protein (TIGR01451 family)